MVRLTWLGEDTEAEAGPSFTVWNGIRFPKGEAVEVNGQDHYGQHMIAKARAGTRFWLVEDKEAKHVEEEKETRQEEEQDLADPQVKEEYDYRQAEKGTGYVKSKKRRKKKAIASAGAGGDANPRPDDADPAC